MSDLTELAADLQGLPAKADRQLRELIRGTGLEATGVMRQEEPVDTGALRASTRMQLEEAGRAIQVGPTVNYAGFVAYGTRRMRPNPFDLRTAERVAPGFYARADQLAEGLL